MHIRIEAMTDVGVSRTNNEDSLFVDAESGLLIIADGVGGARAGEEASRIGTETMADRLLNQLQLNGDADTQILPNMADAIRTAHQWIMDAALADDRYKGMACTLLAVMVRNQRAYVAHVGDSRLYLLRAGELKLLTKDQTMAWQLVDEGYLNPEDVAQSKYRNVLTQAMGGGTEPLPELLALDLESGDRLLGCSDGLSDMLDEEKIVHTLLQQEDTGYATTALIAAANAAGGHDNITVGIIEYIEARTTAERLRRWIGLD